MSFFGRGRQTKQQTHYGTLGNDILMAVGDISFYGMCGVDEATRKEYLQRSYGRGKESREQAKVGAKATPIMK